MGDGYTLLFRRFVPLDVSLMPPFSSPLSQGVSRCPSVGFSSQLEATISGIEPLFNTAVGPE